HRIESDTKHLEACRNASRSVKWQDTRERYSPLGSFHALPGSSDRTCSGMPEAIRPRERGSILIMTALTLTGMLGVTALALDAAYMYDQRNRMGAAADGAALAAAQEYK